MFNRCAITSWSISNSLDQGKALSNKALEHCGRCESCAQLYQQGKLLQLNLNRNSTADTNPRRSRQIINAVHREARASESGTLSGWQVIQSKWLFPIAGVSLAGLLVCFATYSFQPKGATHQSEMADLQEDIQTLTNFVQSASEPLKVFASK